MEIPTHHQLNKKALIYCRVSSHEQATEGNSLLTQERICKEFALSIGCDVIKVYTDDETAKNTNRTQLRQLFDFVVNRKNMISVVIVYKVDRMCRNRDDYHAVRVFLKKYGVTLRAATEPFDDSPIGRFMEYTMANIAHLDNDIRTERAMGGMKDAMRQGRYVWIAPVGYANTGIPGKTNLVQDTVGPVVRKTFVMVSKNTAPLEVIRREMLQEGLVNKGGKALSKSQFYRMLKNPVYAGWIIKFGERHKGLFDPIVSDELFEQVQRVLKYRGRRNYQYVLENPDFPLRRFVSHTAGLKLTGSWSQGRTKKYAYYRFKLPGLEFKKELIETAFVQFIDQFRFDKRNLQKLEQKIEEKFLRKTADHRKAVRKLEARITELKHKQSAIIQKNLSGIISDTVLRTQLDFIEVELLNCYASLSKTPQSESNYKEVLPVVETYLRSPGKTWKNASHERKLRLQWFHFPKGIIFDGRKFRTTEIRSLFKTNDFFLNQLSHKAGFIHLPSNNAEVTTSETNLVNKEKFNNSTGPPDEKFWKQVGDDIVDLYKIMTDVKPENKRDDFATFSNFPLLT